MEQNNQQPGSADLPPLPRAYHSYQTDSGSEFNASWQSAFTDDQMRQYARDAIAASRRAAGGEECPTRTATGAAGTDKTLTVEVTQDLLNNGFNQDACNAALRAAPAGQHEADTRDAAQWREMLAAVMREIPNRFSRDDGNAPGHSHSIPGIWDSDNGAKAGKECAWCKVWNAARSTLAAEQSESTGFRLEGGNTKPSTVPSPATGGDLDVEAERRACMAICQDVLDGWVDDSNRDTAAPLLLECIARVSVRRAATGTPAKGAPGGSGGS